MPLLRSRSDVRRARWTFMKVFFAAIGLMVGVFALVLLVRVVLERIRWA
jgi:hypothetical protein